MISKPLFMQSIKSNWGLWLAASLTMATMITIINTLIGTQTLTTFNIDMIGLMEYEIVLRVHKLSLVGLMETLGFNGEILNSWLKFDIQVMMDDMYYTIGCMLIPMIFVIITANKLLVDQVDRGTMAYVLSTPIKRSKVVVTQMLYLIVSVLGIFAVQAAAAIFSQLIVMKSVNASHILLLNFGGAMVTLAISGICFLASAYFNYSKFAYAFSGGLCVFSFLAKVLGMFGNDMFATVGLGVSTMKIFDYLSILTLLDTTSIASLQTDVPSFAFLWKFAILFGIAIITYTLSIFVFDKKDLSL
ncbi:MAG: ABC transporter permease subunit [Clostridiales bacterium]|nr:ABC transporter permease subunit [Clostridiales bacterium]